MRPRILLSIIVAVVAALVAAGIVATSGGDDGSASDAATGTQWSASPSESSTTGGSLPSTTAAPTAPPGLPAGVPTADETATAPASSADFEVSITYSQWSAAAEVIEVTGFAAVAPEPAGTCTARLVRGNREVVESAPAVADAATMTCGTLAIAGDRVSRGSWSATLTYESASGTGTSPQTMIEVP